MMKIKYWLPTFVWMGLIFYFSSNSRVEVSDDLVVQFVFFKSLHILEYGALFIFFYRSLRNTRKDLFWNNLYYAWILAVVYGATDEIHQKFIPTREGRIRDVAIDAIGVTLGVLFIWKLLPKMPKVLKNWAKKLELI